MKQLPPLALLGLASLAHPCLAASQLEETVVTSSRVEMPLRQVGTSISVVEELEIQSLGYNVLADILRTQPAVGTTNTGGAGGPTALRIRGEDGYRTRVYLDGIDISDPSGTQAMPHFEHLTSSGIARVEILRGPQGLMYGADAGGIVNIQSIHQPEGLSGSLSAEGGEFDTRQLAAAAAGGNGRVDFSLSATDFETDGFNARKDDTLLRDDDGYGNTTLHGRLGVTVGDRVRLELVGRDVDAEGDYDECFTAATFTRSDRCSSEYDQRAWRAGAKVSFDRFRHELAYSTNDTERQFYTEDLPTFGGTGELERWSYLGQYRGDDLLNLVFGAERQQESFDDGLLGHRRDQDSAYLEYQGGFGKALYLTAGARRDDNEDFGAHTSYRLSAAYLFSRRAGELKLKGAWGTGFRAPSLYEEAYNRDFGFFPAAGAELQEERSAGFDLGLAWAGDNGNYLEATWFRQQIEDEIYFDLASYSGYLQGSGTTESRGIELAAEWPLGDRLRLKGNYTWNETEDAAGQPRLRRPEHLANLGLHWHPLPERLQLGLQLRLTRDGVGANDERLDDYELLDFSASFHLLHHLTLYGRVENLLDEDYEEVPGYNTRGRAAYAGLRYSL